MDKIKKQKKKMMELEDVEFISPHPMNTPKIYPQVENSHWKQTENWQKDSLQ